MRKLFYLLVVLTTFSCVVPRNYPKAKWKVDKIVAKWPEVLQNDTTVVKVDTTIITPQTQVDTVVKVSKNDTIYIEKEKLKIRVIKGKRDTLRITGECEPDTIRVNVIKKIPVYKLEEKNLKTLGGFQWWWILVGVLIILIIYIGILKYKEKVRKLKELEGS